ncbi:MAG: FAD-binding protein [Planctomycetota bacterium]
MSFPENLQAIIESDYPLAPLVWFGIGGPAQYFARPSSVEQLADLVQSARAQSIPVRILGSGSNVLVRESGVDGLVISMEQIERADPKVDGEKLICSAGTKLTSAVLAAVGASLGGLEHLIGIPGTVGAAVIGNVSHGGRDIGSLVDSVSVIDGEGKTARISGEEISFGHRKSSLGGVVLTEVTFALSTKPVETVTKRMQKLWIGRNASLPEEERRISMPFVDPESMPAADLIVQVGMAGARQGNASGASSNAEYLIAHAGATADDVLQLVDRVRSQVLLQTGIDLQLNLQVW